MIFFRLFTQPVAKCLNSFKSILSDASCTKPLTYALLLLNSNRFIDFVNKINDTKTELNEVLIKVAVVSWEVFLVPIYYLDVSESMCNITQYTGKHVSFPNQLITTCFLSFDVYGNTDGSSITG